LNFKRLTACGSNIPQTPFWFVPIRRQEMSQVGEVLHL
jgi:hypothetical protein